MYTPNHAPKDYASMGSWELYSSALRIEYQQFHDEGLDVAQYKPLVEEIAKLPPSPVRDALAGAVADLMFSVPKRPDYPYDKPSDYREFKRPASPLMARYSSFLCSRTQKKSVVLGWDALRAACWVSQLRASEQTNCIQS